MEQINLNEIHDARVREWYYKKHCSKSGFSIVSTKYPTILEIESTSRCNVNPPCPMCQRAVRDTSKEKDMPEHLVKWLMSPIQNVKEISISGIGEPMMAQSFYNMINIKSSARLSFFCNGQILTEKNMKIILEKPVTVIKFSIDAATPNTYRKIRGFDMSTFSTVINNISSLITMRNERNQRFPWIHLIMVLMKENYQELPDLVTLAGKIGANGTIFWLHKFNSYGLCGISVLQKWSAL